MASWNPDYTRRTPQASVSHLSRPARRTRVFGLGSSRQLRWRTPLPRESWTVRIIFNEVDFFNSHGVSLITRHQVRQEVAPPTGSTAEAIVQGLVTRDDEEISSRDPSRLGIAAPVAQEQPRSSRYSSLLRVEYTTTECGLDCPPSRFVPRPYNHGEGGGKTRRGGATTARASQIAHRGFVQDASVVRFLGALGSSDVRQVGVREDVHPRCVLAALRVGHDRAKPCGHQEEEKPRGRRVEAGGSEFCVFLHALLTAEMLPRHSIGREPLLRPGVPRKTRGFKSLGHV